MSLAFVGAYLLGACLTAMYMGYSRQRYYDKFEIPAWGLLLHLVWPVIWAAMLFDRLEVFGAWLARKGR